MFGRVPLMATRRIASYILVLVVGVLAGMLVPNLVNPSQVKAIAYGVLAENTLMVRVISSPKARCEVNEVDQSPTTVRIVIGCEEPLGSQPLDAVSRFLVVRLQAPLGSRAVVDGFGNPAEMCSDTLCGAASS
jgi:hypothetical protein